MVNTPGKINTLNKPKNQIASRNSMNHKDNKDFFYQPSNNRFNVFTTKNNSKYNKDPSLNQSQSNNLFTKDDMTSGTLYNNYSNNANVMTTTQSKNKNNCNAFSNLNCLNPNNNIKNIKIKNINNHKVSPLKYGINFNNNNNNNNNEFSVNLLSPQNMHMNIQIPDSLKTTPVANEGKFADKIISKYATRNLNNHKNTNENKYYSSYQK